MGDERLGLELISYGARITRLRVPDRNGRLADVVLGFDNLRQYLEPEPYFGPTVGRVANRIAGGEFTIDGHAYSLSRNEGTKTLHGGKVGFDKRVWKAKPVGDSAVRFSRLSPDGEEGFPGNLEVSTTFSVSGSELTIDYVATTDKPTPVNLTNHSYFNLAGAGSGTILDHVATFFARAYTPVNDDLIPTGEIRGVDGTVFDFTRPVALGSRVPQQVNGFDVNFVLDATGQGLQAAARVHHPPSGRVLEVSTTQPGIQLYTGQYLDGSLSGIGGRYPKFGALVLEPQHFPDSVHHPNFPSTILRPGQTYRERAVYRFSIE